MIASNTVDVMEVTPSGHILVLLGESTKSENMQASLNFNLELQKLPAHFGNNLY